MNRSAALAPILLALALATPSWGGTAPAEARRSFRSNVPINAPATPWQNLNFAADPTNFHFAIIPGLSQIRQEAHLPKVVRKLNLLQPAFVVAAGGLSTPGQDASAKADGAEKTADLTQLTMPLLPVVGAADLASEGTALAWKERFGRTYYHFVYKDVLFISLNTADPSPGQISREQVKYVASVLAKHPKPRWTFLFMDQPLWQTPAGRAQLKPIEDRLDKRPCTVFAGPQGEFSRAEHDGRTYYVLTNGDDDSSKGPIYGRFDHLVWVSLTDDGPIVLNILQEGVHGDDPVTDARRADPGPRRPGRRQRKPIQN